MTHWREVPVDRWRAECAALLADGLVYFDMLSAAELPDGSGVEITVHVAEPVTPIRHGFLVTRVAYDEALPSIAAVYAGAAWHEREIHEMFGLAIDGHPDLRPLLLDGSGGAPLRKSHHLAARVETPWPGREGRKRPLGVPREQ